MLLVADVNGVSDLIAVSACFSIPHVIISAFSIVIEQHPMLLIADVFHMSSSSAEIANSFRGIDGDISRFEIKIRRNVT